MSGRSSRAETMASISSSGREKRGNIVWCDPRFVCEINDCAMERRTVAQAQVYTGARLRSTKELAFSLEL
jgi:hypothetical protein